MKFVKKRGESKGNRIVVDRSQILEHFVNLIA